MRTRAWIFHTSATITRLYGWAFGIANWIKDACPELDPETCITDKSIVYCPDYNDALLDATAPGLRVLIGAILIGSLLYDIACYKYRHLAHYTLYIETFATQLYMLVPMPLYLNLSTFFMAGFYVTIFIAFYCHSGKQIIFLTVASVT